MSGNKFTPGTIVMYDPAREGIKGRLVKAEVLESVPYSIKIAPIGESAGWAANQGWYPEFWVAPKSVTVPWDLPWNRTSEPRAQVSGEEVKRTNRNFRPEDPRRGEEKTKKILVAIFGYRLLPVAILLTVSLIIASIYDFVSSIFGY